MQQGRLMPAGYNSQARGVYFDADFLPYHTKNGYFAPVIILKMVLYACFLLFIYYFCFKEQKNIV